MKLIKSNLKIKYILLGIVYLLVALFYFLYLQVFSNKNILKWNSRITTAEVINIEESYKKSCRDDRYIGKFYTSCYYRPITYKYSVNGYEYIDNGKYKTYDKDIINSIKIGDNIKITYDDSNNGKSVIGENIYKIYPLDWFVIIVCIGLSIYNTIKGIKITKAKI